MKGEKSDMLVCDKCRIVGKPANAYKVGLSQLRQPTPGLPPIPGGGRPLINMSQGSVDLCDSCSAELASSVLKLIVFKETGHEDRDTEVDRIVPITAALAREEPGPSSATDRQPTSDGPPPLRSRVRKNDGG